MIQYQHVAQISENVGVHSRKQPLGIQEQADLPMEAKRLLELFHSHVQHMLRVNGKKGNSGQQPQWFYPLVNIQKAIENGHL